MKTFQHIRNAEKLIRTSPALLTLFLEVFLGVFLTICSLFLFIKIRGEVLEKEFMNFDMQILHTFYTYRSPALNNFMTLITNLGGNFMIIIWIGLIAFLLVKKHTREAVLLGFMLGMAALINSIIKSLIQRPRPYFHPLVVEKDYSFPSGHAMDSFVFYITLAYLVYHFTKDKKLTAIAVLIALIVVLLIGISRVYLGVHYPSDVIAGYVAGLCWFVSVLLIQKTLVFFKLFKETRKTMLL